METKTETTGNINSVINADNQTALDQKQRIEALTELLNRASAAYYNGEDEIMTNYEWDAAFDELAQLEAATGYILPDSPTQTTGAEETGSSGSENRELHEYPALSLAKTKSVEQLRVWAGARDVWLSWKLDGITLVLTYDDGELNKILTRGNGQTGTNITFMKEALYDVPLKIKEKGHFVVRGEATISYPDFEYINSTMEVEKYANPRNLTAGTLGLDARNIDVVKERRVHFNAFTLVHCDHHIVSWGERMDYLDSLGFKTVAHERTGADGIATLVEKFTTIVESGKMELPVDGLVLCYDDTDYAATGSITGHHATNAGLAFKWQDVSAETVLSYVEWSCAASTISPVAVFEPVQLEGTTVSRASLCNISEMKRLGIGEDGKTTLEVIKANKIIPKCVAVKAAEGMFHIPEKCPVCGAPTVVEIAERSGTETLHCTNPDCSAKHIKKYARFVSKAGMDIDGFSIETIVKFLNHNIISDFSDIYHIADKRETIVEMDGFGEKSFENLTKAVEKSRDAEPVHLIYALCIPMIGADAAKRIVNQIGFDGFLKRLREGEEFADLDGIGPERSNSILQWASSGQNREELDRILSEVKLRLPDVIPEENGSLTGMTFVITGSLSHFKNRNELKAQIETMGGTVAGSVSSKTAFLINNDNTSQSAKNKKAQSLGIPILTEEEFISRFLPDSNI